MGSDGKEHKLSDYKGKNVALYFYPKDNTSGCTKEAEDFTEYFKDFDSKNTVIIGISKDSLKSHSNFINKVGIPFLLLSDENEEVINLYDVLKEKSMRACSTSIPNAKLMGINTNGIISLTFGIGAFVAGIGGLCIGSYYNAVYSTMGYMLGMKAFAAAILGGIGSLPGAVLGGFIMGIVECLGSGYISTGYQDAYAFLVLFVILFLRPSGILGAKYIDKV